MLDVSVIIVSWNAKHYLLECLKSVVDDNHDYSREIIVVDNASSDGSIDTVEKSFPQATLIKNNCNLGFARANNIGIRKSSGRYICMINSDVVVLNGCIKNLLQFMEQQPQVGIAGPRILNPDRTLQPCCRNFPTLRNNLNQALGLPRLFPESAFFSDSFMTYWPHDRIQSVDVLSGCFWMVRRQAINQVGLLDENFFIYGEDIDWCKRFHQAGWDVKFFPESEAVHFGAASSHNAPIPFYIEMQKADLYYWKKHHGNIGKIAYSIIIIFRHLLRTAARAFQYIIHPSKITLFKLKRSLYCILWMLHIRKKISAEIVSV